MKQSIQDISKELEEKGVVTIEEFADSETLSGLCSEFDQMTNNEPTVYAQHMDYSAGVARKLLKSKLPNSFVTKQFFSSQFFNDVATTYLNEPFILNKEIFVVEDVPSSTHVAQQLHYDIARTLKFFLYLEDTTVENGSFYCVPGSHKWTAKTREQHSDKIISGNREFTRRLTDEFGPSIPIEGKAGSLIIFDTDVFHQAGKVVKGRRRVMRGHTRTKREIDEQKARFNQQKKSSLIARLINRLR